jgi:PAS domain S-box-containing protein
MALLPLLTGLVLGALITAVLVLRPWQRRSSAPDLDPFRGAAPGAALVRDHRLVWVNDRFAALFGVSKGTLEGAATRWLHENEAACLDFESRAAEELRLHGACRDEILLRRADGSPFWAYLAGAPSGMEGDVLWFLEDVTSRVLARRDQADLLSVNEKLIGASPSAILLYRAADGACILANEAASRILGGANGALLGQNFRRLPSWKTSGLRRAAHAALAAGLEQHVSCHFTSSFGRDVFIEASLLPLLSRGERHLLLLANDVSGRERAFSALRASEERYRVVVDTLNEGLALVDVQGRLTYCNGRLLAMAGFEESEMLGASYADFLRDADRDHLQSLRLLSGTEASRTAEVGLRRRDGVHQDCRVSMAPVRDAAGSVSALVVLVTDISATKAVERERERLLGELEQKNEELETLLYVASHDLRSPLVNIQGFSQRLARSLEDLRQALAGAGSLDAFREAAAPHFQDRVPGSLEFIRASGAKMDAIINGLLTLSRAGRMVIRAEVLDMNAILRACSASLAWQLQSVDGSLRMEDLPPCVADPVQTAQILSNLLDNAIKYRHPGRPLEIRVTGWIRGDRRCYAVEDNGLGIPPEHRDRVWKIFQRLDPHGPVPGEGLGLTLARRMAERNGGRLGLDPEHPDGCRFLLELPWEGMP